MRVQVSSRHLLDVLFPLGLLLTFVSSAVLVLLLAADVYGDITQRSASGYTGKTAAAYVTEKIHQNDLEGCVYAGELAGIPALVLEHPGEQSVYCTYIYYYDQALREVLTLQDSQVGPESGREILPLQNFEIREIKDGLLEFSFTDPEGLQSIAYGATQSGRK